MYRKEEPLAASNAFLAAVAKVAHGEVEVWPENWPILTLFSQLGTQWNVVMSSRTGLRYEAVYPLLDRRFPDEEWEEAFHAIQEMESAVLDVQAESN